MLAPASGLGAQVADSGSVLAPGDVVRITVWRQPEFTGEFTVAADGHVVHPIYRDVRVAGIPMAEVESRIREVLSRYEAQPRFSVEPLVRVAVEGEVRQPSLYTVPLSTSVAQAVAMAGGGTERAKLEEVRLYRTEQRLEVNLTDPEAPLAAATVRSGDRIVVGRRTMIVRDYIAPIASIGGALAAIGTLILRAQN